MIVLVCGDRHWADDFMFEFGPTPAGKRDFNYMMKILARTDSKYGIKKIYQGGARGADQLAKYWGWLASKPMRETLADWDNLGKAAGPIRNTKQLKLMLRWMKHTGEPGMVLAFHRDFENSRGTKDMVKKAHKAGLPVKIYPRQDG